MSDRVLEALQRVLQNWRKSNFTVDSYTGFLFYHKKRNTTGLYQLWCYVSQADRKVQQKQWGSFAGGNAPYPAAHILHQHCKCGNESESLTVSYVACQHYHDPELLRTRQFWQRTGRIFQAGGLKERRCFTTSLLPFKAKAQADLRKYVSIARYTKCRKCLKRQAIPAYKHFWKDSQKLY